MRIGAGCSGRRLGGVDRYDPSVRDGRLYNGGAGEGTATIPDRRLNGAGVRCVQRVSALTLLDGFHILWE
jgi:hypothetical protein